jgi:hypothetical protein
LFGRPAAAVVVFDAKPFLMISPMGEEPWQKRVYLGGGSIAGKTQEFDGGNSAKGPSEGRCRLRQEEGQTEDNMLERARGKNTETPKEVGSIVLVICSVKEIAGPSQANETEKPVDRPSVI